MKPILIGLIGADSGDLESFARRLMSRAESETGLRTAWIQRLPGDLGPIEPVAATAAGSPNPGEAVRRFEPPMADIVVFDAGARLRSHASSGAKPGADEAPAFDPRGIDAILALRLDLQASDRSRARSDRFAAEFGHLLESLRASGLPYSSIAGSAGDRDQAAWAVIQALIGKRGKPSFGPGLPAADRDPSAADPKTRAGLFGRLLDGGDGGWACDRCQAIACEHQARLAAGLTRGEPAISGSRALDPAPD